MSIEPGVLRANPVFAHTPAAVLEDVARGARDVSLPPRTAFIKKGDPPVGVYALLEGHVRVFHADGERQVTVKHLAAPCTLGEMQLMAGLAYVEHAETLTAARLAFIDGERFKRFLDEDPKGTVELLKDVCTRFCAAARNEASVLFEVAPRLASLLLAYADVFGRQADAGLQIRYALTHADLAAGLGVTIKSVSRAMTDWKKQNVVSMHKGWLVLHDVPALEKLSGGLRFNINYRAGGYVDPTRGTAGGA